MERGLLSSPELAAHYDDVVWMYLYQDFSDGEEDRRAQRVAIRFGISSWPQHLVIDPADLAVLGDTGRALESFRAAVTGVRVGTRAEPGLEELRELDALAARVRAEPGTELAEEHLGHPDRVVRYRAVEKLAQAKPELVVPSAGELLAVPHDQLRYVVCDVLAKHGDARHARALEALLRDPGEQSHNPNVVRCRAAVALGTCGDGESLAVLAPFATSGDPFNSLTGLTLDAVVGIAERQEELLPRVRELLVRALPPAPADGDDERRAGAVVRLAERVHEALVELTGEERGFPGQYDAESRRALVQAWRDGSR